MNDDMKPGGSGVSLGDDRRLRHAAAQAAFTLAEVVALRVRDNTISGYSRLTAAAIATQIRDLAQAWARADKLKE